MAFANLVKGLATTRRHVILAMSASTVLLLASACSGGSSGPGSLSAQGPGSSTRAINQLVADEEPADPSLMPDGSTAAKIKAHGELVTGGTQTAALFSQLNPTTGELEGFDAAMAKLLAKYIIGQPKTKLVNVTAATREALLKTGQVDIVLATYTITEKRAKEVNFGGPYYQDGLAIEVRKGTSGITSLADLAGKTVVTESGSTVPTAIRAAAPSAKIQLFDTNTEALQALRQNRADAYVLDQGILAGNAISNPDVRVLPDTFTKEPYGIGLPLDQPDFKVFVNNWLRKIESDGTWARVWENTLGTEVPGPAPTPPSID